MNAILLTDVIVERGKLIFEYPAIFQIKGLKDELEEEKSKREHKTSSVPQINGPEMQLYEVQSKSLTV